MRNSESKIRRVLVTAMIFLVGTTLLDWKSVVGWDWKDINRPVGAFDVGARLAIAVATALLFALASDVAIRRLLPKIISWFSPPKGVGGAGR
jgi:hypothetical protein